MPTIKVLFSTLSFVLSINLNTNEISYKKDQQIVLRVLRLDRRVLQVDRRVRGDKQVLRLDKQVLRVGTRVLRVGEEYHE